jgi:hypothetical protein
MQVYFSATGASAGAGRWRAVGTLQREGACRGGLALGDPSGG